MTRAQLLTSMDAAELHEWQAYFRLEEWLAKNKGDADAVKRKLTKKRARRRGRR